MTVRDSIDYTAPATAEHSTEDKLLRPLVEARSLSQGNVVPAVTVGELVGIADDGRTPLVTYPGQTGSAAFRVKTVVDLRGRHINSKVVLAFEAGDASITMKKDGTIVIKGKSITIQASGKVNVKADSDVVMKGSKILQN
jgi:type VI secretion system secreted protein VgrG